MKAEAQIVRVFIGSNFRDMLAERDHLVTVVSPELRERVEQLGLEFFDVDLRVCRRCSNARLHRAQPLFRQLRRARQGYDGHTGEPAKDLNGETATSWEYRRQSIDRDEPFFVCILGKRTGWEPERVHSRGQADRRQRHEPRSRLGWFQGRTHELQQLIDCRDEIAIGVKGGKIQGILVESETEVKPPIDITPFGGTWNSSAGRFQTPTRSRDLGLPRSRLLAKDGSAGYTIRMAADFTFDPSIALTRQRRVSVIIRKASRSTTAAGNHLVAAASLEVEGRDRMSGFEQRRALCVNMT